MLIFINAPGYSQNSTVLFGQVKDKYNSEEFKEAEILINLNGNEGIMGLQRALKMSGVHNQITTLWQVPDA